ncbi:MAG: toxin-antitoxin system HicB family antitoxin [FCB group bacterium]|nr:toxin-antitoxin system HicB family antitoxin [FCB group bacterium]
MHRSIDAYMSLPYKVELEFNPEDNTWTAFHPQLGKGTCYATADTQGEALAALERDRQELFEILLEEGTPIPEPEFRDDHLPSGQIMLRIPKSLHHRVKEVARREGVSLNQLIATILASEVGTLETREKYKPWIAQILYDKNLESMAALFIKQTVLWEHRLQERSKSDYVVHLPRRENIKRNYNPFISPGGISEKGESYVG